LVFKGICGRRDLGLLAVSTGNLGRGEVASLPGKQAQRWAVLPERILIFRVGRLGTSPLRNSHNWRLSEKKLEAPHYVDDLLFTICTRE
jgi:hypothetical protein